MHNRLQTWKAKILNTAGIDILVKYTLASTPLYTMSVFLFHVSLSRELDQIIRAFWWGHQKGDKKIHRIFWDKISKPKSMGGLGTCDMETFNLALLNTSLEIYNSV